MNKKNIIASLICLTSLNSFSMRQDEALKTTIESFTDIESSTDKECIDKLVKHAKQLVEIKDIEGHFERCFKSNRALLLENKVMLHSLPFYKTELFEKEKKIILEIIKKSFISLLQDAAAKNESVSSGQIYDDLQSFLMSSTKYSEYAKIYQKSNMHSVMERFQKATDRICFLEFCISQSEEFNKLHLNKDRIENVEKEKSLLEKSRKELEEIKSDSEKISKSMIPYMKFREKIKNMTLKFVLKALELKPELVKCFDHSFEEKIKETEGDCERQNWVLRDAIGNYINE